LEGIKMELEAVGFKITSEYISDDKYGAVVVGMDPNFTYHSITEALKVFNNNSDALLIGCNLDATFVGEGGQIFPGTGSLVTAVAHATGRDPIVMGKPNNYIYTALLDSYPGFDPYKAVFIGDRLDSDIAFANLNGMFSILVETGVHKRSDVKGIIPSKVISNLTELLN
jgi:HAD superfamily hydrolase (TIGR01450 family)